MAANSRGQYALLGILIAVPCLIFVALRLNPAWDPIWQNSIFHFYIVSYTALVALVVAVFILAGLGFEGAQAVFIATAFVAMAAFFLLHGAATPGMMMDTISGVASGDPGKSQEYTAMTAINSPTGIGLERQGENPAEYADTGATNSSHGIGLSGRLSLIAGAFFLALGVNNIGQGESRWVMRHRRALWLTLALLYLLYLAIVVGAPGLVQSVEQIAILSSVFAIVSVSLLLWGAWQAWQLYRPKPRRLLLALTLALPWLALAQVSQFISPLWAASWWMYHVLMLAAFVVTMAALVKEYEHVLAFNITHYFTALAIIVGAPLVALLSEVAVRLSGSETVRWPMFAFSALAILAFFAALFVVINRGGAILKERAAALDEASRWRVDFTNLLVHDLKSPLSVISASLSLVLSKRMDGNLSDVIRTQLERAQRSNYETLTLVDNLLDVERLEAGALRLSLSPIDLGALLRETVESLGPLAEVYELQLDLAVPDMLPTPQADKDLLRRVLQNLLTNAIKFTPRHGRVYVEAMAAADGVSLRVTDTGPGIPPDQRDLIFKKFVQVNKVERRGAGLGLTLCKLAVEAHGGRIWVEDAPQGGSRFVFTLPARKLAASAVPEKVGLSDGLRNGQ